MKGRGGGAGIPLGVGEFLAGRGVIRASRAWIPPGSIGKEKEKGKRKVYVSNCCGWGWEVMRKRGGGVGW